MSKEIKDLKQSVIAYKAALEFDYCPETKKASEVKKLFGYDIGEIKAALNEHQGRRPDEIAGTICNLVDQIPSPK